MFELPTGALTSLPNETLFQIFSYLDEPDLRALTQVNRRLSGPASLILWDSVYADPTRPKEVLLWAVETGHHEMLRTMLERGTTPNFYDLSPLLRSCLMDLFAAQGGRRGTAAPRDDRLRQTELLKEKYCRNGVTRRSVRHRHERDRGGIPLAQDFDWHVDHEYADHHGCPLERFGIVETLDDPETRKYWSWSPIHVAVLRGDNEAVRLLVHGASIDARCSGLCDCAAPDFEAEEELGDSIMPNKYRTIWTPLHVAICTGNEDTARLLIALGASTVVGGLLRQHVPVDYTDCRLRVTALHSAAWLGSIQMCTVLLEDIRFRITIDYRGRQGHTALHYAAAGGHIRTVGKLLLENGAWFQGYDDPAEMKYRHVINDPLRLLCMLHKYDDARWLVGFCRRLYAKESFTPVQLYTRALATLCSLRSPAAYSTLTLRQKQDRLFATTVSDIKWTVQRERSIQAAEASRIARLSFAILLLNLGANPNLPELVPKKITMQGLGVELGSAIHRTSLQIAAYSGFAEMVALLLRYGADCNLIGGPVNDFNELPVLLAAREPPHKAKWIGFGINRYLAWVNPTSDLRTIYTLLNCGASLRDVGGESVLKILLGTGELGRSFNFTQSDEDGWLRIAEVLLGHGAALKTSVRNWESIVVRACKPGHLQLCKMLWAPRPITPLYQNTLYRMVVHSVTPDPLNHIYRYREDPEMVRWVLQHCVGTDGRLLVPTSTLNSLMQDRVDGLLMRETNDVLEEFIRTMT
ncbi:Ankyrin repeat domain-containing protein 17 [Madurella mycetomatis]|uniref:Ankyrin repeat domain-containing protein 17 n=1 Tax=Madurella mycetomatis TaxID=100816 RepID=A0A175W0Z8_9PEZI|nr:Ankyrin repeat domain-containing protein 17 [Madurella mycetomatis]